MNRGEIWMVNLNPTKGAEIKKVRPAIIVSNDAVGVLPLRVVVPITDWKTKFAVGFDWLVKISPNSINGLSKVSAADCFQVRSLSVTRIISKVGELDLTTLRKIEIALAKVLKI